MMERADLQKAHDNALQDQVEETARAHAMMKRSPSRFLGGGGGGFLYFCSFLMKIIRNFSYFCMLFTEYYVLMKTCVFSCFFDGDGARGLAEGPRQCAAGPGGGDRACALHDEAVPEQTSWRRWAAPKWMDFPVRIIEPRVRTGCLVCCRHCHRSL